MFKVFDFLKQAIKSSNVFTSPVNLRYKLDPDYNTFAGGVVSIILILLLMSVFFNSWKALLNKTDISSTTEVVREFDPSYLGVNGNNFMFAVGINGMNLTDNSQKKFFNLTVSRVEFTKHQNGSSWDEFKLNLEPCTENHWEQFGDNFIQTYKRQSMSSYLCPPRNHSIEVIGKWTSENFTFLKVSFEKCEGPSCKSAQEIKAWVDSKKSFYFNFFYSNTLLNPDQTEPISMIFEDKDFTMFSPSLGTYTNIYLSEYTMTTDESIFPWNEDAVEKGYIVNQAEKQNMDFIPGQNDPYCQLFLRKSNTKYNIERKFRKLDDMLSYIGGLFGIISVAVGVVMKYYGQCSFELEMCQKIFDYHNSKHDKNAIQEPCDHANDRRESIEANAIYQNSIDVSYLNQQCADSMQEVIEPKNFGFLDFLLFIVVYEPLKKLCNFKWKRMQIYEESLEEMRFKLDISQLMEKLTFFDRSINALFDQNQLKLLYLQQKFNFQEVRNERNMLNLREDIVQGLFESKETNFTDSQESSSIEEQKIPLKEIGKRNSKRILTFMGGRKSTANLIDMLASEKKKKSASQKSDQALKLPIEIKRALAKLDSKIQKGDVISTRIYNGLQFELLEAYENSVMNKNGHAVTSKKITRKHIHNEMQEVKKVGRSERMKDYAEYVMSPSLTSIRKLRE